MWIGNDVIDLSFAGKPHPRFSRRIMAPSEHEVFDRQGSHEAELWLRWAVKEASYKLFKQKFPAIFFAPPEFVVDLNALTVSWRQFVIPFFTDISPERIHVWCFMADSEVNLQLQVQLHANSSEHSKAVRDLALQLLGELQGIGARELGEYAIVSGSDKIPRFVDQNGKGALSYGVSLSHDGRFVAAVVAAKK